MGKKQKEIYWPLMNTNERGFKTVNISVSYQRSSAFIGGQHCLSCAYE